MRTLRIGLAQVNPTVGDLDGNFERIVAFTDRARAQGVELLAFPEMALPGYPPEDLLLKPAFIQRTLERTRDLLPHTAGMTVIVGSLERDVDLYNAAAIMHDGQWMGTARKRYLPNYGVFDENRYFMSERRSAVFDRGGVVFGVNVCEDIWLAGGPSEEQVIRGGAEVLLNLSASPYHAQKAAERRRMISTRASDNLAIVCYVNLVGGQDEIVFDGASFILDERGRPLAEGALFAEDLVVADVDLDEVFNARLHDTRLRKERALEEEEPLPRIALPAPRVPEPPGRGGTAVVARPALQPRPAAVEVEPTAEIYDALTLGVRDYVRKNGFETVVLGFSGGVDSALTACIAADALGAPHLVGVSMPSEFTSPESRRDAEALARALGVRYYEIPIRSVMDAYRGALATPFAGREPDITEENLQARIRGNYLMALSNKFGWLVLTTGNKSEISVGYSTLYGDTAGGFAVLKDVYKTQVYELARWRNGRGEAIPAHTLARAPSAELRPNQRDQDVLPPYEALDAILRLYVEEDRSVTEIARAGHDEDLVRRVARLVDAAEYKRRQSPPGIKITPRAFGKDRRLPITNRWRG
ncbi:MAG TPA: NAD+ synthase [Candidatus Eisenbacteria bacterium]|nr:NAD+ synthase [Candidatus Eisenbacteria bacterium]